MLSIPKKALPSPCSSPPITLPIVSLSPSSRRSFRRRASSSPPSAVVLVVFPRLASPDSVPPSLGTSLVVTNSCVASESVWVQQTCGTRNRTTRKININDDYNNQIVHFYSKNIEKQPWKLIRWLLNCKSTGVAFACRLTFPWVDILWLGDKDVTCEDKETHVTTTPFLLFQHTPDDAGSLRLAWMPQHILTRQASGGCDEDVSPLEITSDRVLTRIEPVFNLSVIII